MEHFGRLDIVIAKAGVEVVGQSAVDFTEADYDRVFGVNCRGAPFQISFLLASSRHCFHRMERG
jgi:3-oxoacyl-[acyl-carrier protein] reductase